MPLFSLSGLRDAIAFATAAIQRINDSLRSFAVAYIATLILSVINFRQLRDGREQISIGLVRSAAMQMVFGRGILHA